MCSSYKAEILNTTHAYQFPIKYVRRLKYAKCTNALIVVAQWQHALKSSILKYAYSFSYELDEKMGITLKSVL